MKGVLADSQVNGQSNFSPHAHVENILKLARRLPETQRCQKYPQPRDDRSGMNDPFLNWPSLTDDDRLNPMNLGNFLDAIAQARMANENPRGPLSRTPFTFRPL